MRNAALLLLTPACALLPMHAQAAPGLPAEKIERNVIYGMYSGLALLMDVYHPENPNGYGVIHISGSGWTRTLDYDAKLLNHAGHVRLEGAALVAAGYTVFSINHRALPRFTYPAPVDDVQRAVRFIRYHAKDYGINPERIGAVGGSSGGHLVSMLGLLDGKGDSDDESRINRVSAKVQCVVARATPTDLTGGIGSQLLGLEHGTAVLPGAPGYAKAREASPITHVTADDPPFLLLHGDKDETVPHELSVRLKAALEAVKVPVKLVTVRGAGHGPSFKGAIDMPDLDKERVAWLDEYLRRE